MDRMLSGSRILGVSFRLTFYKKERVGIIKIVPGLSLDPSANYLNRGIRDRLTDIGISTRELTWRFTTLRTARKGARRANYLTFSACLDLANRGMGWVRGHHSLSWLGSQSRSLASDRARGGGSRIPMLP